MWVKMDATDRAQSVAHFHCGLSSQLEVFRYEVPLIGAVNSPRTAAVSTDRYEAITIHVCIRIRFGYVRVRPLKNQGICNQEPILRFEQVNSHPEHPEYSRARAFVRSFPDQSSAQYLLESSGINSPEDVRDCGKQVGPYDCFTCELRGAVRPGKAVPSWIAVNESTLGIEDVTGRCASLERLHDTREVISHNALPTRFARHHRGL